MIIAAPDLLIDGAFTGPGAVEVKDGVITAILLGATSGDVRFESGFLTPGLIDVQNNGAFGVDCASAEADEFSLFIEKLAACGVTSVLPTIITAPLPALHAAASRIAEAMQAHGGILGVHMEGPFLAAEKRGAHRRDWLLPPAPAVMEAVLAMPALRLITLAPELPGALAAIKQLAASGIIVSLGHTNATAEEMRDAAAAGASMVTHVFNAQSALGHRAPGAPGVALTDARFYPCLIADAVHVDPAILQMAFAACPRAIAVSDSISLAGMPVGTEQKFGGAMARLSAQGVAKRPDGTIAGAAITLDEGVRRLIAAGVPVAAAFTAATSHPAAALGLTDRGRLAIGQRADLVAWSADYQPIHVFRAGQAAQRKITVKTPDYARPELAELDLWPAAKIVAAFLGQERAAQAALATQAAPLASLAEAIAEKMAAGGRLFYAGAGTSGRLAVLDAAECGPTFGIPDGLILPLLAGGPGAFLKAAEGAEDDTESPLAALTAHHFGPADSMVGIAASGNTPFTLAAIRAARDLGGLTGAIVNTSNSLCAQAASHVIEISSGPEIIAGSTRLSAGTAQKIALNILSSTIMIRLNKTYGPFMVDMRAANEKLRRRAIRMVCAITSAREDAAIASLEECNWHVKTAAVMLKHQVSAATASQTLEKQNNALRRALNAQD
jgi:N-acetylmuramic acid 6-phosphate etherase/N-acetylglucosamine-6-phosphate deacetylase